MLATIAERLRHGVPASELRSPFDPRARWLYLIIAAETVVAVGLIGLTDFSVDRAVWLILPGWSLALLLSAMLLRRYGHARFSGAMESTALTYIQGLPDLVIMFPLTAVSAPFADERLAAADRLMGFDWLSFANLFLNRPVAQHALVIIYHSFNWESLVVIPLLFAFGHEHRGWAVATAACLAAVATALIFPFVPAEGAFRHFHVAAASFPQIQSPWQFGPILHLIKDHGARFVSPALFTGFVSFPSYHAAAAAIFIWAMWPFRRARWLFLLLNTAMAISALVVGAHYLVDVIAGVSVGFISCFVGGKLCQYPSGAPDISLPFADNAPTAAVIG